MSESDEWDSWLFPEDILGAGQSSDAVFADIEQRLGEIDLSTRAKMEESRHIIRAATEGVLVKLAEKDVREAHILQRMLEAKDKMGAGSADLLQLASLITESADNAENDRQRLAFSNLGKIAYIASNVGVATALSMSAGPNQQIEAILSNAQAEVDNLVDASPSVQIALREVIEEVG